MEMTPEIEKNYREAGRILEMARRFGIPLIKEGASVIDVGNAIEAKIKELGGGIGFPTNLSINEIAAHDIPDIGDNRVFSDGDVIKLDIGVHVDGYVADSAVTVIVGDNEIGKQLYEVNSKALDAALKMFTPGQKLSEISRTIEETIRNEGFNPIANLSGHGLARFTVHTHPSVANVATNDTYILKEGDVLACEPFVTDGQGFVNEHDKCHIYGYRQDKSIRLPEGRKILNLAKNSYSELPFAQRWLVQDGISPLKAKMAVRQLVQVGALRDYPVLIEASRGLVTQKEHSIIVKDKPLVYTRDVE